MAKAKEVIPLQEQFFVPGRMAIVYHNPDHELSGQVIEPNDPRLPPEGLQFPHLTDEDITMLRKKRILKPAPIIKKQKEKEAD